MVDEILVGDALTILCQVARDEQHLGMLGQEAVGDAVHDLHTLAQQFAVGRKIVLESLDVRLEQFGRSNGHRRRRTFSIRNCLAPCPSDKARKTRVE